jgi:Antitoxin Xre/MbcA/ParS C-terminal toxin-binding domain
VWDREGQPTLVLKHPPKHNEVTRLRDALAGIIEDETLDDWLQRPNRQLDGSTPLQVIERGETDRLWQVIWHLREGNSG